MITPTAIPRRAIDLSEYSYDAIVFDCDGTLVNSAPLHYQSFYLALLDQGASFPREWYFERLGLTRVDLISLFSQSLQLNIDVNVAVESSERHYVRLASSVELIPEIAAVARSMHKVVPLAVASSGQHQSVTASLKAVGLLALFDHLVTADDVTEHKPSPEPYEASARLLGISPERCLVFEDSDEGIESAQGAGCSVVDVRNHAAIYRG